MSSNQPFRITVDVNVRGAEQIKKTEEQIKRTGKTAEQITERTWSKFDRFAKWAFMRIMGLLGVMFVWERMWRTIAEESVDVGVLMDEWSIIVSDALMPLGETIANILDTLTSFLEVMRDLVEREDALGMATRYLLAVGFTFFFLLERLAMPILSLGITVGYLASGIGTLSSKFKELLVSTKTVSPELARLAQSMKITETSGKNLVKLGITPSILSTQELDSVVARYARGLERTDTRVQGFVRSVRPLVKEQRRHFQIIGGLTDGFKKLGRRFLENRKGSLVFARGLTPVNKSMTTTNTQFLVFNKLSRKANRNMKTMTRGIKRLGKKAMIAGGAIASIGMMLLFSGEMGEYVSEIFEVIGDILGEYFAPVFEFILDILYSIEDALGENTGFWSLLASILGTVAGAAMTVGGVLLTLSGQPYIGVPLILAGGFLNLNNILALSKEGLIELGKPFPELQAVANLTINALKEYLSSFDKKTEESEGIFEKLIKTLMSVPEKVAEPWNTLSEFWSEIMNSMYKKTQTTVLNILRELAKLRGELAGTVTKIEAQRAIYLGYRTTREFERAVSSGMLRVMEWTRTPTGALGYVRPAGAKWTPPPAQRGGYVIEEGLAYLHPAEIIVPYREPVPSTREIVINNIFNVEATVREEADIYRIAEELSRLQREGV